MGICVQAIPSTTAATACIHIQPRRLMLPRQTTTTTRSPLGWAPGLLYTPTNTSTGVGVFGLVLRIALNLQNYP
jgi:hypothetical protein